MPLEPEKQSGDWSLTDIQAWMVIKWPSITGDYSVLDLPVDVLNYLLTLFPTLTEEGVPLELIQLSIDYGLNEIPTANMQVAIGRRTDQLTVLSALHYIVDKFKLFLSASVYLKISGRSAQGVFDLWPTEDNNITPREFRIFDGHITGAHFVTTSQSAEFRCSMVHWLSDLNFSSTLSRSSSPQNPGQISYDPSVPGMPNAGARGPSNLFHGSPLTQAMPIINSSTLQLDLWGKQGNLANPGNANGAVAALGVGGLKQWFTEICRNDRINWRQIRDGACGQTIPTTVFDKNVEALAALSRIEPLSNGYIDGTPLAMDARPGISNLADQLATYIGSSAATIHNHTIWDKLVGEFGPTMQFSIVPQVEKALIVPTNPGLRKYWATVYATDYDYFERADLIHRPLRGVGLFVGRDFAAGGTASLNNNPIYNTIGSYYENPDRRNGMVVWKEAPRWLATVPLPHMNQVAAQGLAASNALAAGTGAVPNQPPPKCKIEQTKSLWCDYARALYVQEVLRGRNGRLSGRLRFDIAPGSIIRIEEPVDPFVMKALNASKTFITAQVVRVSCVVNVEAKKAGTAIQFAFDRDESENQDGSYSLDRHPIWCNNWYGAPLVNEQEFYPGGQAPGISPPESKKQALQAEDCNGKGTLPDNADDEDDE